MYVDKHESEQRRTVIQARAVGNQRHRVGRDENKRRRGGDDGEWAVGSRTVARRCQHPGQDNSGDDGQGQNETDEIQVWVALHFVLKLEAAVASIVGIDGISRVEDNVGVIVRVASCRSDKRLLVINELECHRLGRQKGVGQAKVQSLSVDGEIVQVLSVGNSDRDLLHSNYPSGCGVRGAKARGVHHVRRGSELHLPGNRVLARCRLLVDIRNHQGVGTRGIYRTRSRRNRTARFQCSVI